jgi:predicted ribosome quality control (RQC) complex YloA/Tae2 family protein
MKEELFKHNSIDYIIQIGQNKYDNFDIIEQSTSRDIWFHVEGIPSCHVILKTEGKISDIHRKVIKRCAYLCKINSKAKTLKICDISYTTIDNVIKTDIIGQVKVKKCKIIRV